jgi:hypothetical protein
MSHDVLISYSTTDKTVAEAICARLEAESVRCWIAPRDITPGKEWGEAIMEAIAESKVIVLIFSADSNHSPQVKREITAAVNHNKLLVPFRIDGTLPDKTMRYLLNVSHWLDAMKPPMRDHIQHLVTVVKHIVDGQNTSDLSSDAMPRSNGTPTKRKYPFLVPCIILAAMVVGMMIFAVLPRPPQNHPAPITHKQPPPPPPPFRSEQGAPGPDHHRPPEPHWDMDHGRRSLADSEYNRRPPRPPRR